MNTAELKQIIDQRPPEERKWMAAYLIDEMFSVPELRQTAQELSELAQRRGDLLGRRSRVAEAEDHWNKIDSGPGNEPICGDPWQKADAQIRPSNERAYFVKVVPLEAPCRFRPREQAENRERLTRLGPRDSELISRL